VQRLGSREWRRRREWRASVKPAVVIVPGFLADCGSYAALAQGLRDAGYEYTQVVPMRWFNWLPCVGGRSVRPVLDRIEHTVRGVILAADAGPGGGVSAGGDARGLPLVASRGVGYAAGDFVAEMLDASKGAQPGVLAAARAMRGSAGDPEGGGGSTGRPVALVGHSAGGWIARIYLGDRAEYCGEVYGGAEGRVDRLCTLGTPHTSEDSIARKTLGFVNSTYPDVASLRGIRRAVAVGGRGTRGDARGVAGRFPDFTFQSYELCCGDGTAEGDGVTPLCCSHALPGAETLELEGVQHGPQPESKGTWYGSLSALPLWIHALELPGENE